MDRQRGIDINQLSVFSNKAGHRRAAIISPRWAIATARPTTPARNSCGRAPASPRRRSPARSRLLAQAFPNLTGAQIVDILFRSADDLGAAGTDAIFGHGRLNIASAFQPIGTTSLAGSQTAVSTTANGDMPAAAGDGGADGDQHADGRGHPRRLFARLRDRPRQDLAQSRSKPSRWRGPCRAAFASPDRPAGPISVAMTVSERHDLPQGFALSRLGIGPDDARRSRLIAGSAIARLDGKTAVALGFSEGAKAIERRLTGAEAGRVPDRQGYLRRPRLLGQARRQPGAAPQPRPDRADAVRRDRQRVAGDQDQRDRLALSLDEPRGRPQFRQDLAVGRDQQSQ